MICYAAATQYRNPAQPGLGFRERALIALTVTILGYTESDERLFFSKTVRKLPHLSIYAVLECTAS